MQKKKLLYKEFYVSIVESLNWAFNFLISKIIIFEINLN